MKKILCPTDFSPVANNAFKYAIEIAKAFNSKLYLCHVYQITKVDYDPNFSKEEQPIKKQAERGMRLTKSQFTEAITQADISLHTVVEEDSTVSLFKRKVIQHDIDLIIMGSKGASGLEKVIFGSVAATALKTAKVPVLIIPPDCSFSSFENIVFAVDNHLLSNKILQPLQKIALALNTKVTLLNVNTTINQEESQQSQVSIPDVETTYRTLPMSGSINETIDTFIENNRCDLLCMVRRKKGFWESLFQKSITENQVYSSKIPLMILPEE